MFERCSSANINDLRPLNLLTEGRLVAVDQETSRSGSLAIAESASAAWSARAVYLSISARDRCPDTAAISLVLEPCSASRRSAALRSPCATHWAGARHASRRPL